MTQTIRCKHCGKEIEITEALLHEVREEILSEVNRKHQKDIENISLKLKREIEEKQGLELTDLKKQLAEQEEKLESFRREELKLREEKRKLEEKEKELALEVERKIDEERKKIEQKILKEEEEKHRFKDKEKEKVIEDLQKALEEAQRKATQTSQQLQGEVLELDLEGELKQAFLHDEIIPIEKGERGGDILQKVKNSFGKTAGGILWETKRAKWSPSWLSKLREDTRKAGATIAVLVSEMLPETIKTFGFIDGVVVTNYSCALGLASILRRGILQVAVAKSTAQNKDQKLEDLYRYLQSDSFRHRFEAYVEGIVSMQQDLETEKRSTQRLWKKREIQIQKTLENIANMYGELQGIMGKSLPEIKLLDTASNTDI
ncbi:DUF2130 domain-containing protein [Candidatus Gottesmanbacteria bacterium]|nr:DUF2130 domain-containing protein [Candidatus Gottesmanbacteria bacterium]